MTKNYEREKVLMAQELTLPVSIPLCSGENKHVIYTFMSLNIPCTTISPCVTVYYSFMIQWSYNIMREIQ